MIRPLETPCWTAGDDHDGEWHYQKADAARHDAANRLAVLEDGYEIQVPVVRLPGRLLLDRRL
jgi:hypothetical protein